MEEDGQDAVAHSPDRRTVKGSFILPGGEGLAASAGEGRTPSAGGGCGVADQDSQAGQGMAENRSPSRAGSGVQQPVAEAVAAAFLPPLTTTVVGVRGR